MPVIEALTEAECYLWAVLSDRSGIDQAEFLWYDQRNEDGCFRARSYQWPWWRDPAPQQIEQSGRDLGKSEGIKVRGFRFPLVWPGQEMLVTAPELIHLEPIVSKIEEQIFNTRLTRELMQKGRSAVTHRPFQLNFQNGARILGRIPQRTGRGVKGIHSLQLEMDEAQDYPKDGWTELVETVRMGLDGAQWRAHGVTRGVRDKFFEFTQETPDNPWKVHRIVGMARPDWDDDERQRKVKQYGGNKDDPDYRRNVLGLHGDATNPIFVLRTLMRQVDQDPTSLYNTEVYRHITIKDEELDYIGDIDNALEFPESHRRYGPRFWAGMDVGFTNDPSEILVFAEYQPTADELKEDKASYRAVPLDAKSRVRLLTRISLFRISHPQQVKAILKVIDFYSPQGYGMDSTGVGLGLFAAIQDLVETEARETGTDKAKRAMQAIKGYNFSEKVLAEIDESVELSPFATMEDTVRDAGIKRLVLELSTDRLREIVDDGRLMLPWDRELVSEFQGQTFSFSKATQDAYGRARRIFSTGTFHALDAARMAALCMTQAPIEEMVANAAPGPVFDSFL